MAVPAEQHQSVILSLLPPDEQNNLFELLVQSPCEFTFIQNDGAGQMGPPGQDGSYLATLKASKKQVESMPSIRQAYNMKSLNNSQLMRDQKANLPGTATIGNYGGTGFEQVISEQRQLDE